MTSEDYIEVTQDYYNGAIHEMYRECWGGENHHLGIFDETDDFYEAAIRANENLVSRLSITPDTVILDVGSGFCGLPRYIAKNTGCRMVYGLNLSQKENEYARAKNADEGLAERIRVVDGDYNNMPFDENTFDILVSQDAMLHSPDKGRLVAECARVLKPGGCFVFSDILEMDTLSREEAERVYARVKTPNIATRDLYREKLEDAGFEILEIQDLGSANLARSYQEVHDIVEKKRNYLVNEKGAPAEIIDGALEGLRFWVAKGYEDKIGWGLFVARLRG
ncbi:MAG: methyltransferase domain-containing protein [Methanocalculus sp. MSAO_Arc1]|uniref:SAM-dependent methyltransferase n=1 Tax=Methanocalculus TaxID=71151 RepID=UPI000FF3772D|nr:MULTISPECIES: methyltransferase domain-containing protein [unclassified Methanocalculus]MCP1662272.1 sarcosine/dimethylglycine N-methyltransferase [Methanocalculus sp. AMF5]RQD81721.1 MAG: methyltransferase domain-containing protein [Methanocalculus sp. MSAO_Arc1]